MGVWWCLGNDQIGFGSGQRGLGSGLVEAKWGFGGALAMTKLGLVVAKGGLVVAW